MNEFSSAVACLGLAWLTTYFIVGRVGISTVKGRYASIDGLRGYLAFFVFLHHSYIWLIYLRTGEWKIPASSLFIHFGQSSVALFFMITAFLFTLKLIKGKATDQLDWNKLFVSRFLRLVPLYLVAIACVFLIVGVLSNWKLVDTIPKIGTQVVRWVTFTALGAPNVNGVSTSIIISKVTWSLPYEWSFYFMLPTLAIIMGLKVPKAFLMLSLLSIFCLIWLPHNVYNLFSFTGGIVAAFLVRHQALRTFAESSAASFIVLACLMGVVMIFPDTYGILPLVLLALAFILIAAGSGVFGILTNSISRAFGEVAYSIYLLHGILLFVLFTFIIPDAGSSPYYWVYILGVTPILVCICFATFFFIERPAMSFSWRGARSIGHKVV